MASLTFKFLIGWRGVDYAVNGFDWYSIQELAARARWSSNALAAVWLIIGIMGLAHKIASFFREELIVDPIHRHRYMPAAVHVSVKPTLIIDEETLLIGAANREQEFSRLAWLQLASQRNFVANPKILALYLLLPFTASTRSWQTAPTMSCHWVAVSPGQTSLSSASEAYELVQALAVLSFSP